MKPNKLSLALLSLAAALFAAVTATQAQSDATLSDLLPSAGTLTPGFASNTLSYTASVPNATTSITVTPTATDLVFLPTITVNGNTVASGSPSPSISLGVGATNVISTVVVSQDTTATNTYTLTVTRAPSSNADLSNLTSSGGALNPVFDGSTNYTATVSYTTASITVTPTAADATATITVNGNPVTSGNPSGAISLSVGANVITTVVTAQDTVTTKTYTLTVTRTGNAFLANLVPSAGTLSPAFSSNTLNYTASVPFATTSVTVTPTASDPGATITVNGSAVASGNPSGAISLNVGANTITNVVVSVTPFATNTYTLVVARAANRSSATFAWDGGTTNLPSNGDGVSQGGAGTWDMTIQNWDQGSGQPHVAWNNANNDTAVFAGTAGTVTLGLGITAGGLRFNTAGYTITADTLTLAAPGSIAGSASATVSSRLAGSSGLTKSGVNTVTLNSPAVSTFTGGLTLSGGTLLADSANLGTPADMLNSGNTLTLGGGTLSIKGKSTGTTSQTLGNVTINAGGGQILGDKNAGTSTTINLGTLTATASGGSLLVGASGTAANAPVITTTSNTNATGIYGGRVAFFNGTAATGYDWAATTTADPGPYTLSGFSGYTTLPTSGGSSTVNYNLTASTALVGNVDANTLKFAPTAASQALNLGGYILTLASGGLLVTGNNLASLSVSGGTLTAGNSSGSYDLVIHQFNTYNGNGGNTPNNTAIYATIADNAGNPVRLVKAGTGTLILRGTNNFTGGIYVNGGIFGWSNGDGLNFLNHNTMTFFGNTIVLANATTTIDGGITIHNGSVVDIRNNTKTFTVNGPVTGEGGGITLGQNGGGATRLVFNSTNNTFTGPIRFAVTAQDGTLTVGSLADSASLGAGNITFAGSVPQTLNYGATASAALTLNNRQFEMASASSALINNNSSQALTINTDLLGTASGTKTLTLGGTGAGLSTFAGKISNGTITTLNITKANSGTWVLSGANTYNGPTTIAASGGTLSLSSIDVVANPNPLGQSPAAAANLLLGNGTTLKYTGGAASTDRAFTINGTAANHSATLDASGTGAINFTSTNSPAYGTAAQTRTLILTGTNTGANTLAASIGNNTTAAVSLIKNGVGNWVLSGSNTYSGSTTINAGKLTLGGAGTIASTPVITVNSNATFDVTGPGFTLGAAQTLLGNGTILGSVTSDGTLVPGSSIGTLTFSNNLVLNAGSTNTFEVDGSSPANDAIVLGATVTYGGVLNIVPTGTFTNGQTFTLFSGTGATNPGQFGSLVVNPPVIDTSFTFTNGVLKAVVTPSGPTLTNVSPDPVVGSSFPVTLSLTGSGFTGATDVLLTNLTAATGASYVPNVISDTSITVSFVPGTAAASWDATVVNVAPSAQVPFTVTVPTAVSIDAGNLTSAGPGNVVLSGTGGTPGYSYAVLSATNLAPPVVWSPVVTNAFDGGGNFSYTNAVSPGTPVLFLRLEQ